METLDQNELVNNQEVVTPKALNNMSSTSPWMLVMGVLFIVLALLMVLGGAGIVVGADAYSALGLKGAMQMMAVYYVISGFIFGFAGLLLIGSGTKANSFSKYPSSILLESFTEKQKHFWMLMGINALITVVFFIAFFIMAGKIAKLAGSGM